MEPGYLLDGRYQIGELIGKGGHGKVYKAKEDSAAERTMVEKAISLDPKFVDAWAYNGMVPGPWIKLDVGDFVEINVTNNTELGTDVHWHGISTPNNMDGVAPYTQDPILTGNLVRLAEPLTKWAVEAQDAAEVPVLLSRAFKTAKQSVDRALDT